MNEHKYAFVEPGRDRRKRREQLKALMKTDPGAVRSQALAALAVEFHDNRELNMAMDTARHVLEETADGVAYIIDAYIRADRPDIVIEQLAMLADLSRWLEHPRLIALVRTMAYDRAMQWCECCDGRERERRLDTLRRRFDDDLANDIDLALI